MNDRVRLLPTEYGTFRKDIRDFLREEALRGAKRVMDPMAGTAPFIPDVEKGGLVGHFNDILPVYYYLNQAKTCDVFQAFRATEKQDEGFVLRELLRCLDGLKRKRWVISEKWIEDTILDCLLRAWQRASDYQKPIAKIMRAAILLCVRPYSSCTASGNTTWLKPGGISTGEKLSSVVETSLQRFRRFYEAHYADAPLPRKTACRISCKPAIDLSVRKTFDVIFTSPPYPNRFEPVRAYGPELYFLQATGHDLNLEFLLGTTKVKGYDFYHQDRDFILRASPRTIRFLDDVRKKARKGENDYYLRYFGRYYAGLYRTLDHVIPLMAPSSRFFVATQDNVHRGELNSMAEFLCDFFRTRGLRAQIPFCRPRTHQGRRNISARYPLAMKTHRECVVEARR